MTKSLVFSLDNENFKKDKDILLAGEWVLECSQNNVRNTKFDTFYSKSDQKKFRIQNHSDRHPRRGRDRTREGLRTSRERRRSLSRRRRRSRRSRRRSRS